LKSGVRDPSEVSGQGISPEEDVGGSGAAVKGLGAGKGENPFSPGSGSQPGLDAIFQHRLYGRGKAAPMDDQDRPFPCGDGLFQEGVKGLSSLLHVHAVQVDVGLNGKIAPMKPPGIGDRDRNPCLFDVFRSLCNGEAFAARDELLKLQKNIGSLIRWRWRGPSSGFCKTDAVPD